MRTKVNGQMVDSIRRHFQDVVEPWVEYRLDNGTIFRLKFVVTDIYQTSELNQDGQPIFTFNGTPVTSVVSTDEA